MLAWLYLFLIIPRLPDFTGPIFILIFTKGYLGSLFLSLWGGGGIGLSPAALYNIATKEKVRYRNRRRFLHSVFVDWTIPVDNISLTADLYRPCLTSSPFRLGLVLATHLASVVMAWTMAYLSTATLQEDLEGNATLRTQTSRSHLTYCISSSSFSYPPLDACLSGCKKSAVTPWNSKIDFS